MESRISTERPQAPGEARGPRSRNRLIAAAAAIALATGLLAGCAGAPSAIINVPGSYTADLWAPTLETPQGRAPTKRVLVCLDTESALEFSLTSEGLPYINGYIHILDWPGQPELPENFGPSYTSPVLQPGCGLVVFGTDCCFIPNFITLTVTKASA